MRAQTLGDPTSVPVGPTQARRADVATSMTGDVAMRSPEETAAVQTPVAETQKPLSPEGPGGQSAAPTDDYKEAFPDLARAAKSAARWACQVCLKDLSAPNMRKFLHVRHRNGVRSDNRNANMTTICISCLANQPGHEHLQTLPELYEYRSLALFLDGGIWR